MARKPIQQREAELYELEEGEEFFYEDSDGKKQDADLHKRIIRAVEWPIDEKIMGPIRDRYQYGDKKPKKKGK